MHRALAPCAARKPRLLLPNSVYPEPSEADSVVLSVGNVQAGEPYQLQLVHTLQRAEHGSVVEDGPLRAVCAALAAAARLVHPEKPCIAILAKPLAILALRTRVDVRGVGERLRAEHGVRVLYVTIDELAGAHVDARSRDLRLGPHAVSAIYVRYDFSHPYGSHVEHGDRRLHEGELAVSLRREWRAVEAMETSNAVVSSSLGSRLAHRRRVQYHLVNHAGVLERFLCENQAAAPDISASMKGP